MAQPHQQYSMPARTDSPGATSPGGGLQWSFPPHKRQRTEANSASQPGSPYVQSPYGMSPGTPSAPSTTASPHFSNVQLSPNSYNTPYSNGNPPSTNLPNPNQSFYPTPNLSPHAFPGQHQASDNPSNAHNDLMMARSPPGIMGPPPVKTVEKAREKDDPNDILGAVGIDLADEERYMLSQYRPAYDIPQAGSQVGNISASRAFTQFAPGGVGSFYGAGPANQPADPTKLSQEEFQQKAADQAWYAAAQSLAVSRSKELNNPFLTVGKVQLRMAKIAKENGLSLNLGPNGAMGTMKLPQNFAKSTVNISSTVGPDGVLLTTSGTFLPEDSLLVDQLALLSISTKHRLRCLLEDASRLARGRRQTSHGVVPAEWADVAIPVKSSSAMPDSDVRSGWESAVSPLTKPRKRMFGMCDVIPLLISTGSHSIANILPTPASDGAKTPSGGVKFKNELAQALRGTALKERDLEEERIKKRRAKASGDGSRQASIAPGTPGLIAPDFPEKAFTKKEQKKKAEKVNEAASHAAANTTTAKFLGGGRFGNKKYSWMTGGGSGPASGTSTPSRIHTQGLPGLGVGAVSNRPERLTSEGVRRIGEWREDREKGANIQLRDWVAVLEDDGMEKRALQRAYTLLDTSEPK